MEEALGGIGGMLGITILIGVVVLAVYWLILPILLVSKLNKVIEHLAVSRQTLDWIDHRLRQQVRQEGKQASEPQEHA